MKNILYGEFLKPNYKRILIFSVIFVGLINYISFKYIGLLNFLSFDKTYFIFNVGIVWAILSVWILIWLTNKRRGY